MKEKIAATILFTLMAPMAIVGGIATWNRLTFGESYPILMAASDRETWRSKDLLWNMVSNEQQTMERYKQLAMDMAASGSLKDGTTDKKKR
jgi:hypothetical protein